MNCRVGIKFNEERSRPLCFAGMDPVVLERCVNMISGLVDVQVGNSRNLGSTFYSSL